MKTIYAVGGGRWEKMTGNCAQFKACCRNRDNLGNGGLEQGRSRDWKEKSRDANWTGVVLLKYEILTRGSRGDKTWSCSIKKEAEGVKRRRGAIIKKRERVSNTNGRKLR